MQRHFLFLQGLPGPSFRMLATALRAAGHRVSRINLNGGDWLDWRIGDAVNYRGTSEDWPVWLRRHIVDNAVTDIMLFGELRPRHRAAIALTSDLPVRLFEFEEGYLRPNHVTIERWSNGAKLMAARPQERGGNEIAVAGLFSNRMRQSIAYWLAATLAHPWFPDYRSHRIYPAWLETIYWVRRWWRKPGEQRRSKAAVAAMANRRFFLFPLQLDGDAQIVGRSSFVSMANALDHVLESFAEYAPKDSQLLVKRHPFDPDLSDWASQVGEQSGQRGIADRVHYVSRFDLDPLLQRCEGVVTVNSTVGPIALALDRPVHVMGQAIYHRPGLTHDGALDDFWCAPPPPGQSAFAAFTAELKARSQVNGGFHSDAGLQLLIANALRILLDDTPR